jgi:hypothetical protein
MDMLIRAGVILCAVIGVSVLLGAGMALLDAGLRRVSLGRLAGRAATPPTHAEMRRNDSRM